MNLIADLLTAIRGIMVVFILLLGYTRGVDAHPAISILLVACWVTDVLDGKLARKAEAPTHLGKMDVFADLGLALALALCLVFWDILSIFPVLLVIGFVAISSLIFRFYAIQKFTMGMTYAGFTFVVWQFKPFWAWFIFSGVVAVAFLNPRRTQEQVSGFLGEVGNLFVKPETERKKEPDQRIR